MAFMSDPVAWYSYGRSNTQLAWQLKGSAAWWSSRPIYGRFARCPVRPDPESIRPESEVVSPRV